MGAIFGCRSTPDIVCPERLYNRLQDFRACTLVLDLRSTAEFIEAHVDGACHVDAKSTRVHALVGELVEAVFSEIHGPFKFVVAFCCGKRTTSAAAKIIEVLACHQWRDNATLSEVWRFDFKDYHKHFPFACSDYPGFEESRLLPAAVSVEPRVYLSSWPLAEDPYIFGALRPTHIVNCTPDLPHVFNAEGEATYFRVPVADDSNEDLLVHLDKVVAFIEDALHNGGTVLCHCHHGQGRSASVLAAWLIDCHHWSVEEAISFLKSCRPRVSPKQGLIKQLERWAPFRVTFGAPLDDGTLSMHPATTKPMDTPVCAAPVINADEQDEEFSPCKRNDLTVLVQS